MCVFVINAVMDESVVDSGLPIVFMKQIGVNDVGSNCECNAFDDVREELTLYYQVANLVDKNVRELTEDEELLAMVFDIDDFIMTCELFTNDLCVNVCVGDEYIC